MQAQTVALTFSGILAGICMHRLHRFKVCQSLAVILCIVHF